MKKIIISFLISAIVSVVSAQAFDFSIRDSWQATPSLHSIHPQFDSSGAVGILDERRIEYKTENKDIFIYATYHRIIKVKDDKGIEMFNKIYVPVYRNSEINDIKARTVLPDGKVIDLTADKIKEIEEEGNTYKLFAMDGVEKGAEVEYTYTVKRNLNLFGSETFQSGSLPYQQARFYLVTPKHLKFDVKAYNGFKISTDSVINDERIIMGYDNDIKELDDEKYAYRDKYLERVDYKLSYNLDTGPDVRLYTWKEFAKRVFEYYTTRTAKEDKALDGFIAKIPTPANTGDAAKILAAEDYIKTNINIDEKLIAQSPDAIADVIKNKGANHDGIVKFFAGVFNKLNIGFQLVFPSSRSDYPLDEELENWNRTDDILFFFPSTGKFIDPKNEALRYPYIPENFTATRGLFLKGTTIGSFTTAIGNFADIPMEPFSEHAINMEADIKFDETLDTLLISSSQILRGYGAAGYRPVYAFLPKDRQDEANKEIIKSVSGSTNISNIKIQNKELTNYFDNKPLVISGDIKSTELLERAGNKILLKIGEVIGPQEQMYQEKPRQLPVELPFPHTLERKITLHIPDGYTIKNPSDLNFSVQHKQNGETTMGFVSSYTQNGNTMKILIEENYMQVQYPLSQFEEFKKIINTSADFNKVVLVLEKK